jgi:hypothetical protein
MSDTPARVLLLFLDGVGIGAPDPATNPFALAHLPVLRGWLGGRLPLAGEAGGHDAPALLGRADATLGVAGRPQSGTGQTALLTGENAPRLFGRHFGSWVPTALRPLLVERSLFARAVAAGRSVCFANAYPLGDVERMLSRRPPAFPLAAHAAGLLVRGAEALRAGRAVASSITHERWRERFGPDAVPEVDAAGAGEVLAGLVGDHELTVFAHYDTDIVGHMGEMPAAVAVLERVDAFLGGLLSRLPPETLVVLASDHGNVEDISTGHTLNPVPLIAAGPGRAHMVERVRDLTDVVPLLLTFLGSED